MYTEGDVETLIKIFHKVLREVVENIKEDQLITFVLEKKQPYMILDQLKSGFHLHFPYEMNMDKVDYNIHVLPRVIKELEKINYLSKYNLKMDSIIDKGLTSKCWLLYGSMKSVASGSYRLTKIYNSKMEKITLESVAKKLKIYDSEEEQIKFTKPIEYYLPQILSIRQSKNKVQCRTNLEIIGKAGLPKKERNTKIYNDDLSINQIYSVCQDLMKMISPTRVDEYDDWMRLGWTLYSIGEGAVEFMELWIAKS